MSVEIRELVTKLGFKVDESGIRKAESGFKSLKTLAIGLSASVLAIGTGLFAMAKSVANVGDQAVKTSQKVGVSVEGFQRLAYAAELSDVNTEGLATGLKFLSKNLVDATEGGKDTAKAFQSIGINPKKYLGDTEGLVAAISTQFQKLPDGAKKTALAMKIFGKSGVELIPLLNGGGQAIKDLGAEAELFGVVIDETTAKVGEEFNDQLTRTHSIISGLKNIIGAALLPYFKRAVDAFVDWWRINGQIVRQKTKEYVEDFVVAVKVLYFQVGRVGGALKDLIDRFGGLEKVAKSAALAIGLFYAAKTLNGIGVLALSLGKIVSGLLSVRRGAIIANAAVAALPALIAVIGIAVGAIIATIYRHFGNFKKAMIQYAIDITSGWYGVFSSLFSYLIQGFQDTAKVASGLLSINPATVIQTIKDIRSGDAFKGSREASEKVTNSFGEVSKLKSVGLGSNSFSKDVKNDFKLITDALKDFKDGFKPENVSAVGPLQSPRAVQSFERGVDLGKISKTVHQVNNVKVEVSENNFESKVYSVIQKLLRGAQEDLSTQAK